MRIIYPVGNLVLPTDRNPSKVFLNYNATLAASSVDTQRDTYTVPANRRAVIGGIMLSENVTTVVVGTFTSYIRLVINPAGVNKIVASTYLQLLPVGSKDLVALTSDLVLSAGDIAELHTQINFTTGAVLFQGYVTLTEYDA